MASNEKYINNYFANSDRYTIDRDTIDLVQEINKKKHNCFKPKNVTNETREIYHRKYVPQ